LPATNITILAGMAGTGSLDHFLSPINGTITTLDDPGDLAATLSTGALEGVGPGTFISITADATIHFDDVGALILQTGLGGNAGFTGNTGAISFANVANTVSTGGGSLSFSAGLDLTVADLNTNGGDVSLTAATVGVGSLQFENILTNGSGTLTFQATGVGSTITQSGSSSTATGQTIDATATGTISVNSLSGTTVTLTSNTGAVSSAGSQPVEASTQLNVNAATGITLNTLAAALQATNTTAGDVSITQAAAPAQTLTVLGTGVVNGAAGGSVTLSNLGAGITVSGSGVQSNNGDVTLTADTMTLTSAVDAGTGIVTLEPFSSGQPIDLGHNPSLLPGELGLAQGDLNNVTAGILRIGSSSAGSIAFTAPITDVGTGWTTLSLITGATVSELGGSITVTSLAVQAASLIGLGGTNAVSNVAASSTSSGFDFLDSLSLTVTTEDGVSGISTGGSILVESSVASTSLTVSQPVTTNGGQDITFTFDNMTLSAGVSATGHRVTLQPFSGGQLIDVGGPDAVGTLGLDSTDLGNVTADTLQVGDSSSGDLTVSAAITLTTVTTLDLETGGGIVQGASGSLTVPDLALRAVAGIGSAGALAVAGPTTVAFRNTANGNVQISGAGALTIGAVDGLDGTSGNEVADLAPGGFVTLSASSPITFAVNTSSSDTYTATTTETAGETTTTLPPPDDDITVNANVTVESTGGDVDFTSGDSIIIQAGATVKSDTGAVNLRIGVGDNDNDATLVINGTVSGNLNITAPGDIILDDLGVINLPGQTVTITSTGGAVLDSTNPADTGDETDITAAKLALKAATGIGTATDPIVTDVATLAAQTTGGGVFLRNLAALDINSVGSATGLSTDDGSAIIVSTTAGDLTVDAGVDTFGSIHLTAGSTAGSPDHFLTNNATTGPLVAGVGIFANDVTLSADRMALGGGTIAANGVGPAQIVTLEPFTAGRTIDLGGTGDPTGTLQISGAEVNTIGEAGVVRVGSPTAGALSVTASIAPLHTSTLSLLSGGAITQPGGSLTVTNLNAEGAGGVTLTDPANAVTNLSGGALPAAGPGSAQFFSTGNPNGLMATGSRPDSVNGIEIESADDFVLSSPTLITSASFTGLLPTGAPLGNVSQVVVEIYRVFPLDSTNPPSGAVPTRVNSPSDDAFDSRSSAAGELTFSPVLLAGSFTANNSVLNGIHPIPNQTTGGEGPVTGEEVQVTTDFTSPILLPAGHYFFVPQVLLTSGNFFWLSAPKPIVPPGTPFAPDLQEWIRNANLDPNWLRVGTDIVGAGAFNNVFALTGQAFAGPAPAFSFTDSTALNIGSVDGASGINTDGGAITVHTTAGDLTVNDGVNARSGAIDLTAGGAGALLTNNAAVANSGGNPIQLVADRMALGSGSITAVGGGRVTLRSSTNGDAVNLGSTTDTALATLELSDAELNTVATFGTLQIGDGNAGDITVSAAISLTSVRTLALETGGAVVDANAAEPDVTVANLALRTANGASLDTAVSNLAFDNTTSLGVTISNTGALTVNSVDGLTASSNAGGATTLSASSPITFAVDTTSAGTITATTTETAGETVTPLPPPDDDITVNTNVTVESTGGDVDFTSADSIITQSGSVLKSDSGAVNLTAGMGDTDNDAAFHLQGTISAATINVSSPGTIYLDDLNLSTSGVTTLSVTSTGGAILDSSNPSDTGDDVDVTAGKLALSASTGIGTAAVPIRTQVNAIEAQTATGGIFIHNGVTTPTTLAVGGVSGALNGVTVTTSGAISLVNEGSIQIVTGGETVEGPGAVTVMANGATADVQTGGGNGIPQDPGAIVSSGGTVTVQAGQDVLLGNPAGSGQQYGDVQGGGSVVLTAGRNVVVDAGTFVDAHGAGTVTVTAGGDVSLLMSNGATAARITTQGGGISLTTGPGGLLTVDSDDVNGAIRTTQAGGNGAISITADRIDLTSNDSIRAGTGTITIQQKSAAWAINLGSTVDTTASTLELSNAEVGELHAGAVNIGDPANTGDVTISTAITATNTPQLELFTAGSISSTAAANVVTVTRLGLTAGTGVGSSGTAIATSVSNIEATTATGGVFVANAGHALTIGGVDSNLLGVRVTGASGDVSLTNDNPISINLTGEIVTGPGNVTVDATGATSDVLTGGGNSEQTGSVVSTGPTSTVTVQAGRDLLLGDTSGSGSNGDVFSFGKIVLVAGRDILDDEGTFIEAKGSGASGTIDATAGRDVSILHTGGVLDAYFSSAGGTITVTTGANGTFTADSDPVPFGNGDASIFTDDTTVAGIPTSGGDIVINADRVNITAGDLLRAGTGSVTIQQVSPAWAIDLGSTVDTTPGTLELSDAELDRVEAAVLRIGDPGNTGDITVSAAIDSEGSYPTLSLRTGGGIVNGPAGSLLVANLALRAATGIGAGGTIAVIGPINVAFDNTTSGTVGIASTGALTIAAVDGLNTSANAAAGQATTLSAASPMTFAVDTSSVGTLTATATETTPATAHLDNITVDPAVTVESTGGDVVFQAGDDIIVSATAVVQAPAGNIDFQTGFGDNDNEGVMALDGTVAADAATGTVTLNVNSTNSALAAGTDIVTEAATGSITGAGLLLLNSPAGAPGRFALDASTNNLVGTIAAITQAGIDFQNSAALTVGTVTSPNEGITGNGILTNDHDVTLCADAGDISITQGLDAGTGAVRLHAADAVTQNAVGKITAGDLGVVAGGDITLDQASPTNHVTGTVALNTTGGVVNFMSDAAFTVGTVAADGCFPGASGISSAGNDVTLCSPGDLNLTSPIDAGTGTVRLEAGGAVTQSAGAAITAANLGVRAGGDIDLAVTGSPNSVSGTVALDGSGAPAGSLIDFLDGTGFSVGGTVSAQGCFTAAAAGVTANAGPVTLTAGGTVTDTAVDGVPDVVGTAITVNVTGGTIGTSAAAPLELDASTRLDASSGGGNIFITDTTGGVAVGQINAGTGNVVLTSLGNFPAVPTGNGSSIVGVSPNDGVPEVIGNVVTLNATGPTTGDAGQIGFFTSSAQFFEVAATTLNASTNNSRAWISAIGGAAVGSVNLGTNTAFLRTVNGNLTSTHTGSTPDVIAASVNLSSPGTSGSFGSAANPLLVQTGTLKATVTGTGSINVTNVAAGGDLTVTGATTTNGAINLAAAGGNLTTSGTTGTVISAPGNTVTLNASGAIVSGTAAAATDVGGAGLAVTGATAVGTAANPLKTAVTTFAATDGAGGVFVANTGALTVGSVGGVNGITGTGGAVNVSASGPLTVAQNVQDAGDVTLSALASSPPTGGDNLAVNAGVTVKSTAGNVTLNAGNSLSVPTGAVVQASGMVTLNEGTEGNGGTLTLTGTATGTSLTLQGGAGNDTFVINTTGSSALSANGGAGANVFNVTPSTTTPMTLDGGSGNANVFNFDATSLPVATSPGRYTAAGRQAVAFTDMQGIGLDDAGAVSSFYGPNTSDRGTALAGLSAQQRFVQVLYLDALGRAGSQAELNGWVAAFNNTPGTQTQQQALVANGIERSPEARTHLVQTWYEAFLGRQAQGGEEQGWVNLLLAGQTEEQVLSGILGGPEFFNHAQTLVGTGTPSQRFVQALYQLLLNRTGGTGEVSGWVSVLPGLSDQGVALVFLGTPEFRTNLIEAYYNALLHRPSDPGLRGWLSSGLDATSIRVGFESGSEFFANG
jgi:hypothetical protein